MSGPRAQSARSRLMSRAAWSKLLTPRTWATRSWAAPGLRPLVRPRLPRIPDGHPSRLLTPAAPASRRWRCMTTLACSRLSLVPHTSAGKPSRAERPSLSIRRRTCSMPQLVSRPHRGSVSTHHEPRPDPTRSIVMMWGAPRFAPSHRQGLTQLAGGSRLQFPWRGSPTARPRRR